MYKALHLLLGLYINILNIQSYSSGAFAMGRIGVAL